uniref:non-specific serine/threonine protein kinase n=1 Tax=Oryza punctata TaxID=4537 RepID=A0A0E0JQ25_ORYPU
MAEGRPLLKQKDLMVISYSCSAGTKPTWILSLLLILVAETQVVHGVSPTGMCVCAGFLNIDCGLTNRSTYNDILTNLTYVSDREYVEGGKSYNIMAQYMADATNEQEKTLRCFPEGQRNCYTIPSTSGKKYLIRATFTYGNYDGLNSSENGSLFLFGLHIGVNFWTTVNLTNWGSPDTVWKEVITVASDTNISVCLINLGSGTPFISTLDLRKLDDAMFLFLNPSVSISYFIRLRFGEVDDFITRYPKDPFDRFWEAAHRYKFPWRNMTTNKEVRRLPGNDNFQVPTAILQKASTIDSNYSEFNVSVRVSNNIDYRSLELLPIFHFAEIGDNNPNRSFDIYDDENLLFDNYRPQPFRVESTYNSRRFLRKKGANFTLRKKASSELPPLINAFEVYSLVRMDNLTTSSDDVNYMKEVKKYYSLARNWNGDPCSPREYSWKGLACNYANGNKNPSIIRVDLSSSGLTGVLHTSFMKMPSLENLDLSHNNLTGPIPDYQLNSLRVLLEGNPICSKVKDRYCGNKKNRTAIVLIAVIVPVVFLLLLVLMCLWRLCWKGKSEEQEDYSIYEEETPLHIDIRRFTYAELKLITNNFQSIIGKGGFGTVYHGILENNDEVAVKVLVETSVAESKDFLPEVQTLSKVHHKNLVALVGYCQNKKCLALVYDFMPRGNLQQLLRGGFTNIDCGFVDGESYTDSITNLTYVSDREFVEGGIHHVVVPKLISGSTDEQEKTLRCFPEGQRNCYTIPSTSGKKYLIRATFTYGNYDGLNSSENGSLFLFGLHIGVNFWTTVNLTNWGSPDTVWKEVITVASDTNISVCLINLGSGTPFISTLDLRKLDDAMFLFLNPSVSISYFIRLRFGEVDDFITRYPKDPFDRFWEAAHRYKFPWRNMTTNKEVRRLPGNDNFQVPTAILQKASTIDSNYSDFNVSVRVSNNIDYRSLELLPIFHFAEIGDNNPNRSFDIYDDENLLFDNYRPQPFRVESTYNSRRFLRKKGANFTLRKKASSELPPLINAFEVYSLVRMDNLTTSSDDVNYMKEVKKYYSLARNWNGDPCSPREYSWKGLACNYANGNKNPSIIRVDLSSSGLTGVLHTSFMKMPSLENLDLSHNNLTGPIPDYQLNSLRVLDLSNNQLDGPISDSILQRFKAGQLELRLEGNPICSKVKDRYCGNKKNRTAIVLIAVIVPVVQTLSKVHHENLVALVGYCQNKKCLALVYDFMPRGNLQQLLRGGYDSILNWEERLHIALDAAQGLEYLHESCTPSIVHRDVKTPNILLDKNLVAKISDFGLSRAFNAAHTHISTVAAGTLGYLDPEYHATFQLTVKTDVYSFGIVLLEIVTGQPPVFMDPQTVHLPNWVRQKIARGSIHDVVDKKLLDQYDATHLQTVIDLAMNCLENASIDRPSMIEVVSVLKRETIDNFNPSKEECHGCRNSKAVPVDDLWSFNNKLRWHLLSVWIYRWGIRNEPHFWAS